MRTTLSGRLTNVWISYRVGEASLTHIVMTGDKYELIG